MIISVIAAAASVVGCFTALAAWIVNRTDKSKERTQAFVALQIKEVAIGLGVRLDNQDTRLKRIEAKIDDGNGAPDGRRRKRKV
jgi:hypothetical protein